VFSTGIEFLKLCVEYSAYFSFKVDGFYKIFALKDFVSSSLYIAVRQIIKTRFLVAATICPLLSSCTKELYVDSKAHFEGPI
jgi:hypothetical protein